MNSWLSRLARDCWSRERTRRYPCPTFQGNRRKPERHLEIRERNELSPYDVLIKYGNFFNVSIDWILGKCPNHARTIYSGTPQNMKQKVDHYIGAGPRHGLAHDEGTSSGPRRDDLQEIKGKGEKVIGGIEWHLKRKLGRGTVP